MKRQSIRVGLRRGFSLRLRCRLGCRFASVTVTRPAGRVTHRGTEARLGAETESLKSQMFTLAMGITHPEGRDSAAGHGDATNSMARGRPKAQVQRQPVHRQHSRGSLRPPTAARAEGCLRLSGRLSTAGAIGQAPARGPGREVTASPRRRQRLSSVTGKNRYL